MTREEKYRAACQELREVHAENERLLAEVARLEQKCIELGDALIEAVPAPAPE